jgi:hypothetical protein
MINAREGMRRLGLLLGVIGAIAGCACSVVASNDIRLLDRRANARTFDVARQLERVQKETPNPGTLEETRRRDLVLRYRLKRLDLSDAGEIQSIGIADGTTLYPEAAPAWWEYFGVLCLPALGFILPWVMIRIVVWVGGGFFQRAPSVAAPAKD